MPLRELNRWLQLTLPTDGPKTLNGLILEMLEEIPDGDVSRADRRASNFEVMRSDDQAIRTVKLFRPARAKAGEHRGAAASSRPAAIAPARTRRGARH